MPGGCPSTGGGLPQLHWYIWTKSPCASADLQYLTLWGRGAWLVLWKLPPSMMKDASWRTSPFRTPPGLPPSADGLRVPPASLLNAGRRVPTPVALGEQTVLYV